MADEEASRAKLDRIWRASKIFTPSAPVQRASLFAGRRRQLFALYAVLGQRGQHAILYGERGVGKTSIANVLAERWADQNKEVVQTYRTNCAAEHTFRAVWRSLFRRMDEDVEEHEISPDRIVEILDAREDYPLIIIDELDRFDDPDGLTSLADTIKALSDQSILATVVLVGVAGSITQLLGDHRSVERCLAQVQMPRMTVKELAQIIDIGMGELSLSIDSRTRGLIAHLSQGLPSYTHLLAREAAIRAISDDRTSVTEDDLSSVVAEITSQGQFSMLRDYTVATSSPRQKHLFAEVLLACALAPKDDLGYFTPKSVQAPLAKVLKHPVRISAYTSHLNAFVTEEHASVLEVVGAPRKYRYRFVDPMMQPFVIMRAVACGMLQVGDLPSAKAESEIPDSI